MSSGGSQSCPYCLARIATSPMQRSYTAGLKIGPLSGNMTNQVQYSNRYSCDFCGRSFSLINFNRYQDFLDRLKITDNVLSSFDLKGYDFVKVISDAQNVRGIIKPFGKQISAIEKIGGKRIIHICISIKASFIVSRALVSCSMRDSMQIRTDTVVWL